VFPTVVREVSPKLLVKANASFPPTVFFTTVIDPVKGGATTVLTIVQVVVTPAATVIAAQPLLV
jgi:hypothetical protein